MPLRSAPTIDNTLADRLQESSLFNSLTGSEARTLARFFRVRHLAPDEWVFKEGDAGDFLGVILDGHVEILKSGDSGQLRRIAGARSGKTIGEMAMVDGERRSACCKTVDRTEIAILTRTDYERLTAVSPDLAHKILLRLARQLSQRLRQTTGHLLDQLDQLE